MKNNSLRIDCFVEQKELKYVQCTKQMQINSYSGVENKTAQGRVGPSEYNSSL